MAQEHCVATLSCCHTQISSIFRPVSILTISDEAIMRLENEDFLSTSDKVALIFLLYEDSSQALNKMSDLLRDEFEFTHIFRDLKDSVDNWKLKVVESLSHIKHFLAIRKLGLDKSDVIIRSKENVSCLKGSLYNLCDQLTVEETESLIEELIHSGFPSPSEKSSPAYLEHYLLHWIVSGISIDSIRDSVHKFLIKIKKEDIIKNGFSATASPIVNSPVTPTRVEYNPNEAYKIIDSNRVGLCIILNEDRYKEGSRRRVGSEKDVQVVRSTMEELNFVVKENLNVGGRSLLDCLGLSLSDFFRDYYSMLFIFVMAHGIEGQITGIDNVSVDIGKIADVTASFKMLNRKPKVLVVQACQGDQSFRCIETDGTPQCPRESRCATDILIAMSTVPGYEAYRHREKGSFYIQKFCEVLKAHRYEDMCKILQRVNREFIKPIVPGRDLGLQPEFRSRLTKDLYLSLPRTDSASSTV